MNKHQAPNKIGLAGKLSALFQANRITPLLAIALFLAGIFAILITPREEEPQIDVTMATITIPWPGAGGAEIENLVTKPSERILARIPGVEHIYSISKPGVALITVQFQVGVKNQVALVLLHDTLRTQNDWLPTDLGILPATVKTKGVDDVPIVTYTLFSDNASFSELNELATKIEHELKTVAGTRDIWTIGTEANTVRVDMDSAKMANLGITVDDISYVIKNSNSSLTAGFIQTNNNNIQIDVDNYLYNSATIKKLVVSADENGPIYLEDIAKITNTPTSLSKYVSYRDQQTNAKAITIAITKKAGANAISVSQQLDTKIEQLKATIIADHIGIINSRNYGQTANDKADTLIHKLIFATLSVILLVMFTLGKKEAVIVGLAVGLTLAATLFASWAWGFTLNRVSLFALIFSIGILVDDAIVVVENIHRHTKLNPGLSLAEKIPLAVDEVGGPTILATFTVIAALLPMAFVSGLMGPYMSPIPINASIGMLISLLIALSFTPWLAYHIKTSQHQTKTHKSHKTFTKIFTPFISGARPGKNRLWLVIATLILVLVSAALPVWGQVELKMLPFDNKSEFQVLVKMPADTPVEITDKALQELGDFLLQQAEVKNLQIYAGTAAPINFNGLVRQYDLRQQQHLGDIQVNLIDKSLRAEQSHAIVMRLRPALNKIATAYHAKLQIVEVPPGPPVMAPVVAEIYGPDTQHRAALAKQVLNVFTHTSGMVDIDESADSAAHKIVINLDRTKIAQHNLDPQAIANTIATGINGARLGYLHGNTAAPTQLVLTLAQDQRSTLHNLFNLPVRNRNGITMTLGELIKTAPALQEQVRLRKDLIPVHYVTADMAGTIDSPLYGMFRARNDIFQNKFNGQTIDEYFTKQPDNPYQSYAIKWDGEWQITYETFRDMGIAYAVGLLLIYLLVVAHFKSYLMPLVIMAPIPLTIIGVMPGHALLGQQFTATSMIGMIALAGIIVRNSILLVDFIILRLQQGADLGTAVIESAAVRAQPIILTAVAATLGGFFILDDPIFNGLAISLIFGIAVATALTLVIIPLLVYSIYHKHPQTLSKQGV